MLNSIQFKKALQNLLPNPQQKSFLCAVSGGADSMVLLHLMYSLGYDVQVAHVNYKLRGKASDLDQKVVEEFCEINKIKFHLYTVSPSDNQPENSIQIWARDLRYQFFFNIIASEKLDGIVTAHHLNDELETFFINLSRGSGIKGLSGMPRQDNKIFRPLLGFSKDQIYDYAHQYHVGFREDASNQKEDYLRNKFRNKLVPELLAIEPHFLTHFSKSITYLSQANDFVEVQIENIFSALSTKKENNWVINKQQLAQQSEFVQYQILKKFGVNSPLEITKIRQAQSGSHFNYEGFWLWINRNEIIISAEKPMMNDGNEEILLIKNKVEVQELNFEFDLSDYLPDWEWNNTNAKQEWIFQLETLVFPIKLRRKKSGDIFFPLGMNGKKKVSKFFKDEKISILAKPKIWLLVDGNDCLLGVLPFRQDGRNKDENIIEAEFRFYWQ